MKEYHSLEKTDKMHYIFIALNLMGFIHFSGSVEYCLTESFNTRCRPNERILIERARFGRMELGRCVTRNFGHIGCSVDVQAQLDYACSGRVSCDLGVSDPSLVRTKPCPKDFTSYLDATYRCVPVIPVDKSLCNNGRDPLTITADRGYLSSLPGYNIIQREPSAVRYPAAISTAALPSGLSPYAAQSSAGEQDALPCTLLFRVDSGQRINFTLLDFTLPADQRRHFVGSGGSVLHRAVHSGTTRREGARVGVGGREDTARVCNRMVVIEETAQGNIVTVCGSSSGGVELPRGNQWDSQRDTWRDEERSRERLIYRSRSNEVKVQMFPPNPTSFLLKFEVTGCSDPRIPSDMYLKHQLESLMVVCNRTEESFVLICQDDARSDDYEDYVYNYQQVEAERTIKMNRRGSGRWRGEIRNCSRHTGMSVAIIFGVAMVTVVYVAIIMVCALHIRRWRKKLKDTRAATERSKCLSTYSDSTYGSTGYGRRLHMTSGHTMTSRGSCCALTSSGDLFSERHSPLRTMKENLSNDELASLASSGRKRYSQCIELSRTSTDPLSCRKFSTVTDDGTFRKLSTVGDCRPFSCHPECKQMCDKMSRCRSTAVVAISPDRTGSKYCRTELLDLETDTDSCAASSLGTSASWGRIALVACKNNTLPRFPSASLVHADQCHTSRRPSAMENQSYEENFPEKYQLDGRSVGASSRCSEPRTMEKIRSDLINIYSNPRAGSCNAGSAPLARDRDECSDLIGLYQLTPLGNHIASPDIVFNGLLPDTN